MATSDLICGWGWPFRPATPTSRPNPTRNAHPISTTSADANNRGGHRQANAALYRVVIVRMRTHQPTLDYVRRRMAEGKSKPEIIRCLKRFVVREIFGNLCRATIAVPPAPAAA